MKQMWLCSWLTLARFTRARDDIIHLEGTLKQAPDMSRNGSRGREHIHTKEASLAVLLISLLLLPSQSNCEK